MLAIVDIIQQGITGPALVVIKNGKIYPINDSLVEPV